MSKTTLLTHSRLVSIFAGTVFACGILVCANARAEDTNATTKLPTVVVTGSLIPTAETAPPTPVDVISATEVEKIGSQNIYQLVRTLPSAYGPGNFGDSRGNGGNGSAGIGLRGIQRGAVVLLNGCRGGPRPPGFA